MGEERAELTWWYRTSYNSKVWGRKGMRKGSRGAGLVLNLSRFSEDRADGTKLLLMQTLYLVKHSIAAAAEPTRSTTRQMERATETERRTTSAGIVGRRGRLISGRCR